MFDMEDAFLLKKALDILIDKWTSDIEKHYKMVDLDYVPIIVCTCNGDNFLPFDFFINEDHHINLCCLCRHCKGYRNVVAADREYPIRFKSEPGAVGLLTDDFDDIERPSTMFT